MEEIYGARIYVEKPGHAIVTVYSQPWHGASEETLRRVKVTPSGAWTAENALTDLGVAVLDLVDQLELHSRAVHQAQEETAEPDQQEP